MRSKILRLLSLSLLLSLGLSLPSDAQLPPWQAIEFFDLTGGLNDTRDPTSITPNEASDLQNIVLSTSGGIEKRPGFDNLTTSSCSASTAVATGVTFYRQSDGDRFLVGVLSDDGSDRIFSMDYGGSGPDGTCDNITPSGGVAVTDNDVPDFAVAEDVIYIEDGVATTAPVRWNGSGVATAISGAPNATMVEFHKRILWFAGRSDARSRVDFSNLDEPETYTSTDFILVETDDGQLITGLRSALDCLYVFKQESIWRICGSDRDNLTLEQMVRGIGAAGNQSIALINNQFLFLTNQGDIAVYDGGITVQVISSKIEGTLTGLNLSRLDEARAVAFDDGTGDEDYYLSVSNSGSGTHNLLLVYDTFFKAWTKFSGINANAMAIYEVSSQQKAIVFGDYAADLHRYPTGDNDNGAAINAYYQSGHLRLDVPQQKIFQEFQVILRQQSSTYNLVFEYRIDFEGAGTSSNLSLAGTGALWDTAIWDVDSYADITTAIRPVFIQRPGDFILWRVSNANADQPFLVRGIRLWVEPTSRVGGET